MGRQRWYEILSVYPLAALLLFDRRKRFFSFSSLVLDEQNRAEKAWTSNMSSGTLENKRRGKCMDSLDECNGHPLRVERAKYNLTQKQLAEAAKVGAITIWRAENGYLINGASRQRLCDYFGKSARELGLFGREKPRGRDISTEKRFLEECSKEDSLVKSNVDLSLFGLSVTDTLDSAESIIDLAWEAWFASRPREAARAVNKLLPNLERVAYSPYPSVSTLLAKNLAIRAHGLLGTVCLDASQNGTALFHYTQAHRRAGEIHDIDMTSTYLCLAGDVLRRQNDQYAALNHMEHARDLASQASKTTRGHVLQLLAYAYGDTGQETAFENAISEATELLAFSGEGIDTVQKEFIPFEVFEIKGKVNRDLGKPIQAIPYLELAEKSLNEADSVTPRWHALLEISRAQTYCDTGDIATGIDLACKGFIMAYQCRSLHQMNRVRKLLRKLENGPFRNHPQVQELKNLLYETYLHMN